MYVNKEHLIVMIDVQEAQVVQQVKHQGQLLAANRNRPHPTWAQSSAPAQSECQPQL